MVRRARARSKDKYAARQKCWNEAHKERLKAYFRERSTGFSAALVAALTALQSGRCAICGSDMRGSAHADHCHDTKVPRGLLCRTCNLAEGYIKKTGLSPEDFGKRLAEYLANPPVKQIQEILG